MNIGSLHHDKNASQFYLTVDEQKAFIDYTIINDQYQLLYSEVPEALRGKGIGKILVERTFAAIAEEGKTAFARCGYVREVAKKNARWNGIVEY